MGETVKYVRVRRNNALEDVLFEVIVQLANGGAAVRIQRGDTVNQVAGELRRLANLLEIGAEFRDNQRPPGGE